MWLDPCRQPVPRVPKNGLARASGFTLVELLVAFTIMALAIAILPIAYNKLTQAVTYQTSIRDFVSEVAAARLQAMSTGRPVAVFVNPAAKTFGVVGQPLRHWPASYAISVTAAEQEVVQGQVAQIRFYPDGSSTGGTVVVNRTPDTGIRFRIDWLTGRLTQSPAQSNG